MTTTRDPTRRGRRATDSGEVLAEDIAKASHSRKHKIAEVGMEVLKQWAPWLLLGLMVLYNANQKSIYETALGEQYVVMDQAIDDAETRGYLRAVVVESHGPRLTALEQQMRTVNLVLQLSPEDAAPLPEVEP